MSNPPSNCPLCGHNSQTHYFQDIRDYWQCDNCALTFVDESEHLDESAEKVRYDLHENSIADEGYCNFLKRLLVPLSERLPEGATGLDFGSGPGPTLSLLMADMGFEVSCYDKYYKPDELLLNNTYDFITSTEVIEHLREPRVELERLIGMLKPDAYLGIMTSLLVPVERFGGWHYKQDPTHISFYARETFEWIANKWNLQLEIHGNNVIILRRGTK